VWGWEKVGCWRPAREGVVVMESSSNGCVMIRRMRDRGESSPSAKIKHLNSQRLRKTKLFAGGHRLEAVIRNQKRDCENPDSF